MYIGEEREGAYRGRRREEEENEKHANKEEQE